MRVFITGGTGLIGTRLIRQLRQRGDDVVLLTRRPEAVRERFGDCTLVVGDPMTPGPWGEALAGCDAVVNLAGENIFGKRWNDEVKRLLLDSRIRTTDNVVAALRGSLCTAAERPRCWSMPPRSATTGRMTMKNSPRSRHRDRTSWPRYAWPGRSRPWR